MMKLLIKPLILSFFLYCLFVPAIADSYQQVLLKHRNATILQSRLLPLVDDRLSITVDGNHLLVGGPTGEVKQLIVLIKKLDRPRRQLQVSTVRGESPAILSTPSEDIQWSTRTRAASRLDTAVIEEEATLLIEDSELMILPIERYIQKGELTGVNNLNISKEHQTSYQSNRYQKQLIKLEMTPVLLVDKQVSVVMSYTLSQPDNRKDKRTVKSSKSTEVSLTRTVLLGEWFNIAGHQQQSNQLELTPSRQISSTQKEGEFKRGLWVKFDLLQ